MGHEGIATIGDQGLSIDHRHILGHGRSFPDEDAPYKL
jgi:hypothetical protein